VATNLKEGGYLYLNANNPQVVKNFQNYIWKNYTVKQFSTEHILNKNFDVENLCWSGQAGGIHFKVKLLGEYGLAFVDAAMQVAALLGVSLEDIKKGIEAIKPVEHRLQPIKSNGNILVIDDAYNGNPDGVKEAIKVLSRFTDRRKVFITPGLVEMGKASNDVHREIGKELVGVADVVVLIKNSVTPWIEQGIKSGLPTTHYPLPTILWFETAQEAHTSLGSILKPNDVVVFQNDWGDQYI
jgi:UDP-N-acetylmuramoyl-tripeptide--D-alanyl-D-alanine ligase